MRKVALAALGLALAAPAARADVSGPDTTREPLARFEAAPDCRSPALAEALDLAHARERRAAGDRDATAAERTAASGPPGVGDAARRHGCGRLAEAVYEYVIGEYVGP